MSHFIALLGFWLFARQKWPREIVPLFRIGIFPGKLWTETALIPKPPVMLIRFLKVTGLFRQSGHPRLKCFAVCVFADEQRYRD